MRLGMQQCFVVSSYGRVEVVILLSASVNASNTYSTRLLYRSYA